ncbi:predicted hydrolase [Longilinea arvoryzae]|uniref:Predicted hydrolase n=1 Tax=Longilinea arvoryzae TaxID=360412 RepID=A0A0S7BG73_9CHLR|nr:alpha/beta hydrolase [Longilinea arvoryzae]GAP12769.1 predicted hydrolase [Longilinea arvoryzae]
MWIVFGVFLACLSILLGVLLANSPGNPEPFLDESGKPLAGSLSEKTFVTIQGAKQGLFIRGRDATNPVLLYVHGGMPEYFLARNYPTRLEDDFTVVWWEQRGSGLSYRADLPPETINLEQFIRDTIEVTNYLRARFGKEKIYLLGHSGGSFIALQAAARAPELYFAYLGVAQMVDQLQSEKMAYDYMLQAFRTAGNRKMARKLEAAPVSLPGGIPDAYLALRDAAMHSLGIGTTRAMKSVITGVFFASLACRAYTLPEKINLWRAKAKSGVSSLWKEIIATDLAQKVPGLDLPVYFFSGIYDYTVSYALAKGYLEKLQAPIKGFYTFHQSAHSPMFEEPEKMRHILREDVLEGTNNLADAH